MHAVAQLLAVVKLSHCLLRRSIAGKTRTLFEVLSWSFGMYFAAPPHPSRASSPTGEGDESELSEAIDTSGSYDLADICQALAGVTAPQQADERLAHTATFAFHLMILLRVILLDWMADLASEAGVQLTPYHWLVFQLLLTNDFPWPDLAGRQRITRWFKQHQRMMLALAWHCASTAEKEADIPSIEVAEYAKETIAELMQSLWAALDRSRPPNSLGASQVQRLFPVFVDGAQSLFHWCEGAFLPRQHRSPSVREKSDSSIPIADEKTYSQRHLNFRPLFSMLARCLNGYLGVFPLCMSGSSSVILTAQSDIGMKLFRQASGRLNLWAVPPYNHCLNRWNTSNNSSSPSCERMLLSCLADMIFLQGRARFAAHFMLLLLTMRDKDVGRVR